ncbi:hypothetical protein PV11_02890 [Exophiala sideris]|uniref:Uncharacterized protein n=1 Tax=Exophiala sideris TaxID=1016849 RepID=A0A0D1YXL4_9EURO|nr:hypothetical protein PV11_02890 [Exophiala sideris]
MATATNKPPYDPVKTVEGMFNGSVTRIAYALKDPLNYAQSTRAVLVETAKKFQDALDDCEIQILDAKWYLEQKLAMNKARREKAREDIAASAKRKRDVEDGVQEKPLEVAKENAPKRVKTAEPEEAAQLQQPQSQQEQQPPPVPVVNSESTSQAPQKPATKAPAPKPAEKAPAKQEVKPTQAPPAPAPKVPEKPPEKAPAMETNMQVPTFDDFTRATPQDTGNEEFNFVSMFGDGDPSADMMAAAGNDMNMNFDMGMGDSFDAGAANLDLQDSSLNSLLPGLESYANQAGDDNSFNMGMPMPTNTNMNTNNNNMVTGAGGSDAAAAMGANDNSLQEVDYSLPALGPNEFDELLNSSDMNFDGNVEFDDNEMGNMEMDLDFDSMFK